MVGPSWVGDMVMAQSACKALIEDHPEHQIWMLAPAWSAPIVARMPEVAGCIPTELAHGKLHLRARKRLANEIKAMRFDRAIVLPNSLKAALIPWLARIPQRSGWVGEQRYGLLNDIRKLNNQALPLTVQRFIALCLPRDAVVPKRDEIAPPALSIDSKTIDEALKAHALTLDKPVLALCPGAEFGPSKQWPLEHYAKVASHYQQLGWQVWLLGSANDAETTHRIQQKSGVACINLAGKTSLTEAVDLLSVAGLVVSNDSGLMHIAGALERPLVAIYGSTDPNHTPPLSANHAIAERELECRPCFKRECPLEHLKCLTELRPETVIAQADSLLAGPLA